MVDWLLRTPEGAWMATAGLWVMALCLAAAVYGIGLGRIPPMEVVVLLPMALLAPAVVAGLVFREVVPAFAWLGVGRATLRLIQTALMFGVAAGYWSWLASLSWRAGEERSRDAFITLAGALGLTSPLWLALVAWAAGH
jgi:hypothetical protein